MKRFLFWLSLLSLPLAACSSDFHWVGGEVSLRIDPKKDEIYMLVIERGLHASEPGKAVQALEHLLEGWRRCPPEGGFLTMDMDDAEEELEQILNANLSPRERDRLVISHDTRVQRAGLFLDDQGRLALFQLWKCSRLQHVLRMMNDVINEGFPTEIEAGVPFQPCFPLLDEPSRDRAVARAREGGGVAFDPRRRGDPRPADHSGMRRQVPGLASRRP